MGVNFTRRFTSLGLGLFGFSWSVFAGQSLEGKYRGM